MEIPGRIMIGDTIDWDFAQFFDLAIDEDGNAITSAAWDLLYSFRRSGEVDPTKVVTITGTADEEGGWDLKILKDSFTTAGTYYFSARLRNKADVTVFKTLVTGQVVILANLTTSTSSFDGRSQLRQDLDAVNAAIRAIISGGAIQEYTVGTRQLKKMAMADLITLQSQLSYQVAREEKADKIKKGLGNPNSLFVRFRK